MPLIAGYGKGTEHVVAALSALPQTDRLGLIVIAVLGLAGGTVWRLRT